MDSKKEKGYVSVNETTCLSHEAWNGFWLQGGCYPRDEVEGSQSTAGMVGSKLGGVAQNYHAEGPHGDDMLRKISSKIRVTDRS